MSTKSDTVSVSITVNGARQQASVAAHLLLADFIRDHLGLTGTKLGCETGQCGACLVLVDGKSVKSCAMLAAQADGCTVTTIEGLSPGEVLTPLQNALWEHHGVQCGFCAPGLVISLTDLLSRNARPSEEEIRRWMDGIFCRCGVYQNAVKAVQSLSQNT
ncbi:MAG TPA: (2Fe-2S)-binding protein [Vicinamibacterales bacterium]|nr:(2Fe-2S)-binding protein [Vicinamibacterales bacterium]